MRVAFTILSTLLLVPLNMGFVCADELGEQILRNHCLACHDSASAEGELDLEQLLTQRPRGQHLKTWRNIAQRIQLGDMPPPDAEPLTQEERKSFAGWFDRTIEQFDYRSVQHPGYEPARRLSHVEYQHTIRDLVGVDLANMSLFPADLTGFSGFENNSNTLFMQGSLLEKYIQSAEAVVSELFSKQGKKAIRLARKKLLAPGNSASSPTARARKILFVFASRAFRRTASEREIAQLSAIFDDQFEQEKDFETAIQKSLVATLVMPQFLMRIERPVESRSPERISDFDLASRISYFLWASMPDNELLSLARQGKLSDPLILDQQVDRMLRNRRAKSLGYDFSAQWLGFKDVGTRRRLDPIDNPWCTDTLMSAMKAETALFFHSLVRDNQPISQLVTARYTYLNEELAKHYRIRGIEGNHMRPVRLKTPQRGGILSHASVLSVTAFPDRTSPVSRGKWVLDTLLGTPPPEPPPNIGDLPEEILEREGLTFRQVFRMHSNNPRCASCHQEIDPLGFSLENFDNFGRWRTRDHGRRVDARGRLPDGTEFEGPEGLRKVVVEKRLDDLTRQLAQKMLTYGLGRELDYYDEASIREIVKTTQADGYRFRTLIRAVIHSYPFQFQQRREPIDVPETEPMETSG